MFNNIIFVFKQIANNIIMFIVKALPNTLHNNLQYVIF